MRLDFETMMQRLILEDLLAWRDDPQRKPLVLLGARQVGKTFILKEFGRNAFNNLVYVNCHNNPFAENLFTDFNIERILYQIEQAYECHIIVDETLLFFDEIQEVKNGMASLKYFCEDKRDLHVVVAGSLLGVGLHKDESYPVGKVNDLRMYPMTFHEFLLANGREQLAGALLEADWSSLKIHHEVLTEYLRQYYFVGGMPEAVAEWIESHDAKRVRGIQRSIISTYTKDMSKHAGTDILRIQQVWNSIPMQLSKENKKFIFGAIKKGSRAADFEKAIQRLLDAGIIYKVERVRTPDEPLKFYADDSAFKIYLHDQGILACMSGARSSSMLLGMEAFTEFKGALTENFVLTQLKAQEMHDDFERNIFYYSKDNSTQEVDFVVQGSNRIVPIEVKAEENIHAKSLRTFIKESFAEKHLKGVRFSMKPYIDQEWMENVPLYGTEAFIRKEGLGCID